MKKKVIIATPVVALSALLFVILTRINLHNLSNRIPDVSVFIPDGISDEYEDAMKDFFNEWQEIWEYELNRHEIAAIDEDLKNVIWKPLSDEQIRKEVLLWTKN